MNLSPEARAALAAASTVRIETRSARDEGHGTTIWVVVDGDDVFVRSVRGAGARWYREARSGRPTAISVGRTGPPIPVTVAPAEDPESIERCSIALRAKYGADPALTPMLEPHALPTTLRVLAGA